MTPSMALFPRGHLCVDLVMTICFYLSLTCVLHYQVRSETKARHASLNIAIFTQKTRRIFLSANYRKTIQTTSGKLKSLNMFDACAFFFFLALLRIIGCRRQSRLVLGSNEREKRTHWIEGKHFSLILSLRHQKDLDGSRLVVNKCVVPL